jgi:hypothetical protein
MQTIHQPRFRALPRCLIVALAAAASAFFATPQAHAEHWTSKWEVRKNLEAGGWRVAYGKELSHQEYLKLAAAIAAAAATQNPAPVTWYLEELFTESVHQMASSASRQFSGVLAGLDKRLIVQALHETMQGRAPRSINFDGIEVQIGLATYRRAEVVTYREPRTERTKISLPFGGWTWGVRVYTAQVKRQISTPNTHQPYIRVRINTHQ